MCRPPRKPLADVATIVHNLLQKHNWSFSSRKITFDLDADLEMTLRFLSGVSMVLTGFTWCRFSNWWITRHRIRYRCLWTSKSFCICTLCCPKTWCGKGGRNDTEKCLFIFPDSIFFKRFRQCLFEWRSLLKNFHWIVQSNWGKLWWTQSLILKIKVQ